MKSQISASNIKTGQIWSKHRIKVKDEDSFFFSDRNVALLFVSGGVSEWTVEQISKLLKYVNVYHVHAVKTEQRKTPYVQTPYVKELELFLPRVFLLLTLRSCGK